MSKSKDTPKPRDSVKRKREDVADRSAKRSQPSTPAKPRNIDYDESIAMMDAVLLSDLFAKSIKRHAGNMTSLELEEKFIPSKTFRTTTDFDQPHTALNLPSYLERFADGGKDKLSKCEQVSSPHTIVIAPSGIRTADLVRELRVFNNEESKVAKLFAKHMKLKDNIQYVQKTKIGIAVGTPGRLLDLFKADAFKATNLKQIIIDGSYRDEKKRTIFDMQELFNPVLDLLTIDQIKDRLSQEKGNVQLYVY